LGSFYFEEGIPPPLDISGVKAKDIAIGGNFLLILDYNNTLLILYNKENKGYMTKLKSGIIAIAAGDIHILIVDENWDVWAKGSNTRGQLGNNTTKFEDEFILVNVPKSKAVYAGHDTSFAIDNEDNVWSWGNNTNNQLGHDYDIDFLVANPKKLQFKCKFISPSKNFTTFIDIDDDIRILGYSDYFDNPVRGEKIKILPKCKKVASGEAHLLMIDLNDNVINWGGVYGWNSRLRNYGPLGISKNTDIVPGMGGRGLSFYGRNSVKISKNPVIFPGMKARDVACYKGSCFIISDMDIESKILGKDWTELSNM
jgi:alpha-tubulin suppressor-like RCC1 family protein